MTDEKRKEAGTAEVNLSIGSGIAKAATALAWAIGIVGVVWICAAYKVGPTFLN